MGDDLHVESTRGAVSVLLVEDDPAHASLVRGLLAEAETAFEVDHVADLASAVGVIERPDCVLVDLGLPDADGPQAVERLIATRRHPAVVVLTGRSDRALALEATARGAHEYLLKDDIDPDLLESSVLKAIERRRVQAHLERSEERYRSLVRMAPAGIITVDRAGRITFVNDRMCDIVGLEEHEIVGSFPADLVDERHRGTSAEAAARLTTGTGADYELEIHRRDGSTRWVHITSKPFLDDAREFDGALVVGTDVTGRRKATDRLRFQAAVLEAVGEAIVVTDPDGTVVLWNDGAEEVYGWSAGEMVGRAAAHLTRTDEADRLELDAALQRGETWHGQVDLPRRDGSSFPALVSTSPMYDEHDQLVGIITVCIDVTERVEYRRALEVRAAQLEAVANVASVALADVTLSSLLHVATEQAATALDADIAEIVACTDDGSFRIDACYGLEREFVAVEIPADVPSLPASTVAQGSGIRLADLSDADLAPFMRARGLVAGAGVVIRVGGEPWGALCTFDRNNRVRPVEHLTVLQSIADLVANSLHRVAVVRELDRRAVTDELTGLPNRAAFRDRLVLALDRHERLAGEVAVLFADLDHFKDINDALGHTVGDEMIRAVGRVMADSLRAGDTVARFGGDEFAILCDPVDGPEQAVAIAERIIGAVRGERFDLEGRELSTSVSIGIAMSGTQPGDAHSLVRNADAAMYRAKAAGGGRVDLYDEGLQRQLVDRLDLGAALRRSVSAGELELRFQPEVALDGSGVVWVESLVRWRHPQLGLLTPGSFIGIAEETGLIHQIGSWVLDAAVGQMAAWRRLDVPTPASVSVNLSARQLLEPDLIDRTAAILEHHGVAPAELWFELTETSLLREPERSLKVLHGLRELGVGLAIDDFGTGYASLAYAQQIPADALKIDRTFVDDMCSNQRDQGIVRAVIEMADGFGMLSIAEGVETESQLHELRRLGCDFAQGYLLTPPITADELLVWIETWLADPGASASEGPSILPASEQ